MRWFLSFSQDLLGEVEQLPAAFRDLLGSLQQEISAELDALQLSHATSAVAANLTATGKTASITYAYIHTHIHAFHPSADII